MANYTIELKDVVSHHRIFDFDYPFYDPHKRAEFEKSFIRHFYFREICCPSVDRFKVYLEDKMNTVFPYYNELFVTAMKEYSILDNYNVTETFKLKRENLGKVAGFSSTVGEVTDEQKSESKDTRETETESETSHNENLKQTGTNKEVDVLTSDGTKTGSEQANKNNTMNKRFLDTPQGALDLDQIDYATNVTKEANIGLDEITKSETSEGTETADKTITRDLTDSKTGTENASGTDKSSGTSENSFEGTQRTTNDNNTRTESKNEHTEEYELVKRAILVLIQMPI